MLDVIELSNEYYIHARSSLVDIQTRVLMRGDLFASFDRCGARARTRRMIGAESKEGLAKHGYMLRHSSRLA